MASPSLMDTLFQRTLDDIIKGLRHQQTGESAFISKAVEEIRREIKATDLPTKSTALQKLAYLNSIFFVDMSWAAFHAIECISSPNFTHKKIGYLAISQSFHDSTPVILLITNQLRKDLKSNNEFEVSLALECLSRIGSVDLCRDLTPEVFTLMSSSKVFVRKKAIGVVLRVFEKYPDAVRVCFKRLVESLDASDPQILSAVVGVFCELASRDPRSYLPLAPEFYRILVDSRNNWVLIKVLKIFAKLAPLEPRLAKRIVEPICDHMRRSGAKSLMFECIMTVACSLTEFESAVKLAVAKIHEFLVEDDPNLKYLGLQALSVVAPKHLWSVLENKEIVIKSLSDADPNIKLASLSLVMAMVSENNVADICRVLVNYALKSDPEFCNDILGSILLTCCRNLYEIIVNFEWYVSLLGEMARIPHCHKGLEIENQLIDIGMRVKDARPELVRIGRDLLIDPALLGNPLLHRILSAASWICAEYVEFSKNPVELMEALLQPRTNLLPPAVRAVYIQSAFKVLIFCLHSYLLQRENIADDMPLEVSALSSRRDCPESSYLAACKGHNHREQDEQFNPRDSNQSYEDLSILDDQKDQTSISAVLEEKHFTQESIINLLNLTELALGPILGSYDVEIQERARNVVGFVELIKQEIVSCSLPNEANLKKEEAKAFKLVELLHDAFCEELGPVSISAQERVCVPDGLMLKENLAELDEICGSIVLSSPVSFSLASPCYGETVGHPFTDLQSKEDTETSNEATSFLAEHRKQHGLYYLPSEKDEIQTNDYPLANDPTSSITAHDDADDLVKLTGQSLVPKRKINHAKPRPVVVKLDEGDVGPITAKKLGTRDDLLSGAVRDVLLGNEAATASSRSNTIDKPFIKRKGKEKLNVDVAVSKENLDDGGKPNQGNTSSRRSKNQSHSKERRKKSPGNKNADERDGKEDKDKQKSRHRHSRHKAWQKADVSLNADEQVPVPDFLL
uniref:AP-3 complex subunit delta n=1 Tax=Rhizophora mucronata TaxID=61149 RepID=A0A2P2MZ15_RHIMU